jgi:broad specificity phosphatase PhoE
MPTRLLLISHAETASMRRAQFPDDDEPLDAHGAAQAATFAAAAACGAPHAQALRGALALSSPAACARETAHAFGLTPAIEPALAGTNHGRWRGQRLADVAVAAPDSLEAWTHDPAASPDGGESFNEVIARVGRWLDALEVPGTVVAVSHAPVLRAAILHVLHAPPASFVHIEIAPLSTVELRRSARGWAWWPGTGA